MLKHLECLIGGSRCGGTYFTAAYLTACGFPCGHERIYAYGSELRSNPASNRPESSGAFSDLKGECSYTVIEWVDLSPANKLPVYLIVRNPLEVLNSCIVADLEHAAMINIDEEARNIRRMYLRHFDLPNFRGIYRVEDELPKLAESLGVRPRIDSLDLARNGHNLGRIKLGTSIVSRYREGERLIELAESFDYKV